MSGEVSADTHKKELRGEEVDAGAEEGEPRDDGGSLSVPGMSKKHVIVGIVLVAVTYGALRWLSGSDESEKESAEGSEDGKEDSDGVEEADISEEIDFSGFEDIEDDEDEDELSFEETQERAVNEITEDTPY